MLLKEFLSDTKPLVVNDEEVYLPDVFQTWSLAVQRNNEEIMSATAAALALLLKTISSWPDMTSHGLGIGRTLLQPPHLELLARSLGAEKGRDFVIAPALRLLREVVAYDGGVLAGAVFRARSHTLRALSRNLSLRFLGEGIEDPKRPSTRSNAVWLVIALLEHLPSDAKRELLAQQDVVHALTQVSSLRRDPPGLLREILRCIEQTVVHDRELPREVKGRCFNVAMLSRLASLYGYEHDDVDGPDSVVEVVHGLLTSVCTSASAGVLVRNTGYYPQGVDPNPSILGDLDKVQTLGIELLSWTTAFENEIPVRNHVLSELVSPKNQLRPWVNAKHRQLIVSVFEAAPELVADYFSKNRLFPLDPKETPTWMGYMAFVYNAVQVEIPEFFGHMGGYARAPPPTSIVLDNILPLPFNQKVFSKSLLHSSPVIAFVAVKFLLLAFEKMQIAIRYHQEASMQISGVVWKEALKKLVDEFGQRAPALSDAFKAYRRIAEDDFQQREACARLLKAYYEVIPQMALAEKYDIAPSLAKSLQRLESLEEATEERLLCLSELQALLTIATYSYGMRWFSPVTGLEYSPFTSLVKLYAEHTESEDASEDDVFKAIYKALESVSSERDLLLAPPHGSGVHALVKSIKATSLEPFAQQIWAFLDSCAHFCTTKGVKYLMQMRKLQGPEHRSEYVSLLAVVIVDQLPYFAKSSRHGLPAMSRFLSNLLSQLELAGEGRATLLAIRAKVNDFLHEENAPMLQETTTAPASLPRSKTRAKTGTKQEPDELDSDVELGTRDPRDGTPSADTDMPFVVPAYEEDNSALYKWPSKSPDELVDTGLLKDIARLLSSPHASIRKEALTALRKLALKFRESACVEKDQMWLIISELVESAADGHLGDRPLPTPLTAFTVHAIDVLKDPLHCLYPKVNSYLLRGPSWSVDALPLLRDILDKAPDAPNSFYTEISWLLAYLADGLRTADDMSIYHKHKVFERIMTEAGNPLMAWNMRCKVLQILFKATTIQGGSDTLVKRFGVLSWLDMREAAADVEDEAKTYKALRTRVWETCDQEHIKSWMAGKK